MKPKKSSSTSVKNSYLFSSCFDATYIFHDNPYRKGAIQWKLKTLTRAHIDKGPKLNNINVNPIQSKSQMEIENRC